METNKIILDRYNYYSNNIINTNTPNWIKGLIKNGRLWYSNILNGALIFLNKDKEFILVKHGDTFVLYEDGEVVLQQLVYF